VHRPNSYPFGFHTTEKVMVSEISGGAVLLILYCNHIVCDLIQKVHSFLSPPSHNGQAGIFLLPQRPV